MATKYWILATGVGDWTNAGNWNGGVPVSGDDVFILQGDSDIQTNITGHSAVVLASLTIGGSFEGTISSDATTQTASPLAIGIATGGLVTINCTSQRIWLDVGSSQPTVVVVQTGSAPVADVVGGESLQIRGGATAANLSVTGSATSVGLCTTVPGLTATWDKIYIENGALNVGAGVTVTTSISQSGNGGNPGGTLVTLGPVPLISQSGTGTLVTAGTGKVTALTATGTVTFGNRTASGVSIDTLILGPTATVDCSQNPLPFQITNSVHMSAGATLTFFKADQMQISGGGNYKIVLDGNASLSDVTINTGGPCAVTVGAS